jgi:hypothetical protein
MTVCRAYENPDLFITFTCNTNWPEIRRELRKERVYKHEDKPNVNSNVSAEIPDKNVDPLCYDIIYKLIIHGPYGSTKPNAQCMPKGKFAKSFPKKFKNSTVFGENEFVYYKQRKCRDNFVLKNGIRLSDNYVVTYSRKLLMQ